MSQTITIKAFGMVAEVIGDTELVLENPGSLLALKKRLAERFPELTNVKFGLALNKKLLSSDVEIPEGSEIALLPPFSGG